MPQPISRRRSCGSRPPMLDEMPQEFGADGAIGAVADEDLVGRRLGQEAVARG